MLGEKIIGAYHIAIMNDWHRILDEQTERLIKSGLLEQTDKVLIGVVGGYLKIGDLHPKLAEKAFIVCDQDLQKYEFHTLKLLRDYAPGRGFKAWYIHTKGVSRPGDLVVQEWRYLMECFIIDHFRDCLFKLDSCDACGINLRETDSSWAAMGFAGNFWWANSAHIERLPKVEGLNWKDRIEAERWVCKCGIHKSFFDIPSDLH
jgi:hypothetical protein